MKSKVIKVAAIVLNALLIGAGILLLFNLNAIVWIISVAIIVYGIMLIAQYFGNKKERSGWDIISGLVHLMFGALILFGTFELKVLGLFAIEVFLIIWIFVSGLVHIVGGVTMKKAGIKRGIWGVITGSVMLVFGIACVIWPKAFAVTMLAVVGVVAGITLIVAGLAGLASVLAFSAVVEQVSEQEVKIESGE